MTSTSFRQGARGGRPPAGRRPRRESEAGGGAGSSTSIEKKEEEHTNVNGFFAQWERRMFDARSELLEEEQTLRRHQRWREEEKRKEEMRKTTEKRGRQAAASGKNTPSSKDTSKTAAGGGRPELSGEDSPAAATSNSSKDARNTDHLPTRRGSEKTSKSSSIPVFHGFDDDDRPDWAPPPSSKFPGGKTSDSFFSPDDESGIPSFNRRTKLDDFLNPDLGERSLDDAKDLAEGREAYEKIWRDHDTQWQKFQEEPPDLLRKEDVPWPPVEGDILEFTEKLWAPGHARQAYRIACRRWHPDKFLQLYGERIPSSEERVAIEEALNGVIQSINQQWERQ